MNILSSLLGSGPKRKVSRASRIKKMAAKIAKREKVAKEKKLEAELKKKLRGY